MSKPSALQGQLESLQRFAGGKDGSGSNPFFLRMLEMPSGRRVFEQQVTSELNYRSLHKNFHSWEGPDEVKGLFFAEEFNSAPFLEAVEKASRGENPLQAAPPPIPPRRAAPPPVPPRDDLEEEAPSNSSKSTSTVSSRPPQRPPPALPVGTEARPPPAAAIPHPNPSIPLQPSPRITNPPLSAGSMPPPAIPARPKGPIGVATPIATAKPAAITTPPLVSRPSATSMTAPIPAAAAASAAPPALTRDRSKTEPDVKPPPVVQSGSQSIGASATKKEGKRATIMNSFSNLFSRSGKNLNASALSNNANTFTVSAPSGFRHESHIGWDKEKGFQVQNIPPDWQKIFAAAGIRKRELKNPETAAFVMSVVSAAAPPSACPSGPSPSIDPNTAPHVAQSSAQPMTVSIQPPRPQRPAPPPPSLATSTTAPPAPPPPPLATTRVPSSSSSGSVGSDLLAEIRQGKELKPVVIPDLAKMAPEESNKLVGALQSAMAARRQAIAPNAAEEADEDDEDWAVEA